MEEHLQVLIERRNWLAARIQAKKSVGWETSPGLHLPPLVPYAAASVGGAGHP